MGKVFEVEMDYDINVPEKMMIISEAEIVNPETGASLVCNAFWDTGATGSCISARAARQLGLVTFSKVQLRGVDSALRKNLYMTSLNIGPYTFNFQRLAEYEDVHADTDLCIGMDIIGNGDFSLIRKHGKIVLRYQLPPQYITKTSK